MTETQIWRASRVYGGQGQAVPVGDACHRRRRVVLRLWTLMHAQAVLDGATGGAGDVALVEDDRRRLAARQAR
jgi:hypothetical protein